MYETILSPINYGGLELKNRIVFAPTSLASGKDGLKERMRKIAAGGCAMIIIGDVPVLPQRFIPSLYSRKGLAWYRELAEGRAGDIRRCIRCNRGCLGGIMSHRGVECIYEMEDKK